MEKYSVHNKSKLSKSKISDLKVSKNKKQPTNINELTKECRRQSLLLKGDPQENQILEYIESEADTQ